MTTQSNGSNLLVQGRIVWITGKTIFEGKQKTDFNTKQPKVDNNGNPVMEYGFGLAIPKINPATGQNSEEFTKVWNVLHQEAFAIYPSGQLPPNFAMKFKDGDGIDHNGQPFANREGYAGHIVLSCTTQIPIKFFRFEGGNNILVNDGIKNGDYVNVQLNVKGHPKIGQGVPGLYLNPSAVQLIQPGKEIINTPSGDQLFGQTAPAYAGQVVADQAPAMPNVAAPTPVQPQAVPAMPGQAAPAPVQPHYPVLPQTLQPGQPQAAPMGNIPVQPAAPAPVAPMPTPAMPPVQPALTHPTAVPSNNQGQAPMVPPMPQ